MLELSVSLYFFNPFLAQYLVWGKTIHFCWKNFQFLKSMSLLLLDVAFVSLLVFS
jgi:hypothetical protein